jgi:phosphonate transport system substrate-binding protein
MILSRRRFVALTRVLAAGMVLAACGSSSATKTANATTQPPTTAAAAPTTTASSATTAVPAPTTAKAMTDSSAVMKEPSRALKISAIPDQDPEKLNRLYGQVSSYLADKLKVKVEYVPVVDYASAVSLFRAGDLDLVWFGGLTGVQASLQTPGAKVLAQRDIDEAFHSVFIANAASSIAPITDTAGLSAFKGKRFTFGSESSTSGRLMPQYFLDQAGLGPDSFNGPAGFSGSHDKTIDLVQSGTFEGGALNEQVWKTRKEKGTVDLTKVVEIYRTPSYHDYHWILQPGAEAVFGADFATKVTGVLTGMDPADALAGPVLQLFGAKKFIPADGGNYAEIEQIGRKLKLIA